ncbi:hypothetical protein IKF86_01045 [Candidatus Saccharibacteria bacterium]|nr:hypothetical protein [Candidatus Saccharibacteria bacterium]
MKSKKFLLVSAFLVVLSTSAIALRIAWRDPNVPSSESLQATTPPPHQETSPVSSEPAATISYSYSISDFLDERYSEQRDKISDLQPIETWGYKGGPRSVNGRPVPTPWQVCFKQKEVLELAEEIRDNPETRAQFQTFLKRFQIGGDSLESYFFYDSQNNIERGVGDFFGISTLFLYNESMGEFFFEHSGSFPVWSESERSRKNFDYFLKFTRDDDGFHAIQFEYRESSDQATDNSVVFYLMFLQTSSSVA